MPRIPYKDLMQSDEMAEKLEMSTAEIGLSVRTTNCLEERGIFTVHDLLNCTRADLLSISNFGEKTLEEVFKALEKIGFFRSARPDRGPSASPSPPSPSHPPDLRPVASAPEIRFCCGSIRDGAFPRWA